MSKTLIISATSGTNLILAKKINDLLDIDKEIVNLEDYRMPLYTPQTEKNNSNLIGFPGLSWFLGDVSFSFCRPQN